MPTVYVTRHFPEQIEQRYASCFDTRLSTNDLPQTADNIVKNAADADALIVCGGDPINQSTIDALPASVRIIATFSVGYDHVDVGAATDRGIVVTNTPDVLTDATADTALLLMLGAARRLTEGQEMVRQRAWTGWYPSMLLGVHMSGKRLGILGMGRIGQAVAQRGRGFDMEVHYHNRKRLPTDQEQGAIFHETPDSLLKCSEFLSLHFPATPETHHFLNEARIALLPDNAIVVNTARGSVIDDTALIAALKDGRIAAAGLDVYDGEPNVNPGYLDLPNTVLMPHAGSSTLETRLAMAECVIENLTAFFAGREPPNRVTMA